jgi:hypothetical protein
MRINLDMRMLRSAGRVTMLCSVLATCAFARDSCTMETFRGGYGLTATGFVLPPASFAGVPGSFASFSSSGTLLPEVAVPIEGVQLITSDGKGKLVDKESLSLGGSPLGAVPPTTSPANPNWVFSNHYGTYKINADCTGTAFLTNQDTTLTGMVNFISLAFVINHEGTKIRMVGVPSCPPAPMVSSCTYDSGGIQRVVTSVGERLDGPEPRFP